ncbi:MAG: ABC transporter permease [Catalinimonas sp.]
MLAIKLFFESLRFATGALRSNLLRTTLSLLGVTIGIFSIIAVLTLVDSLERGVRDSVSFIGEDVIYVQKWPWSFGPNYPWWKYMNRPEVSARDYERLEGNITEDAGLAVFADRGGQTVKYRNNSVGDVRLVGVTYEYNQTTNVPIEEGRYFTYQEAERGRPAAVIGAQVAEVLFNRADPLGREVKIRNLPYVVIGVMERQGANLLGAPSVDNNVLIPYPTYARYLTSSGFGGATIVAKGREDDEGMVELEGELRGLMRASRGLKPRQEDNFALNRPELLARQIDGIFATLTVAGWFIGGFAMLVGGFGIANIMFVSVRERTNQIGIQKALGAKNYFILFQFLFEAVLLSLIGGGAGLFMVFLLTFAPFFGTLEVSMSAGNITMGLAVSSLIGLLAGVVPAASAARMDPVEAIRAA